MSRAFNILGKFHLLKPFPLVSRFAYPNLTQGILSRSGLIVGKIGNTANQMSAFVNKGQNLFNYKNIKI